MTVTRALTMALGVQLLFVAVAWWPQDPSAGLPQPVFDLSREAISQISVASRPAEGEPPEPVVLARKADGDGWVIRSAADFPADAARVDELLDAVLGLRAGPPIATRAASHEALSVGDESYGRRLSVQSDGEPDSWLVGAATSRSVHLRPAGEDTVYLASGASEWSFRDSPSSYWQASYVDEDPARFEAVAVENAHGTLRFERRDGSWTLADLAEGEVAQSDAIESFTAAVARVRMREPVGRTVEDDFGLGTGARIDWTIVADNQSLAGGYAVGAEVESDVYLKAVDHPFVVRVAKSAVKRLREAERSEFVGVDPGEQDADSPGETGPPAGR